MLTIVYNDKAFDAEHYPIEQAHRDLLARIAEHFGIDAGAEWEYFATIHGRIFQTSYKAHEQQRFGRYHTDRLRFLADLEPAGLRWVEAADGRLAFGIQHKPGT